MKLLLIALTILISISCTGQSKFSWLEGQWQNQKSQAIEEWELSKDGLTGMAFKIQYADTIILEKLAINMIENKWYYIADVPHNSSPTQFEIIKIEEDHFICVNPDHDFPKQIEYSLIGKSLAVIISDKEKAITFEFKRLSD